MALMAFENLVLGYDKQVLVEGISFAIQQGDYVSIVGDNGAGKSTFVKAMLQLVKPLSGEVVLGDGLKRSLIGYLPQVRDIQRDFPASVYEIVLSGCLNRCGLRPFYNALEHRVAQENLKRLGIDGLSSRSFRELSGGQQQRVLLARALCASERLIVLDEPTAGLDPETTQNLYDRIDKLNRQDGVTIVMVTHDIAAAERYSSHILTIACRRATFLSNGGRNDHT